MLNRGGRRLLTCVTLCLALVVWLFLPDGNNDAAPPAPGASGAFNGETGAGTGSNDDTDSDGGPDSDGGALDLALRSISLSQGEGGFELWRLKAEWANMYKAEGIIVVLQPRLTYFLRDDQDGEMKVRAEKGDINQDEQILRFIDKVKVTAPDKVLTGELLVYNGTAKSMTLPEGGDFATRSANGRADVITFHIDEKRIFASGGVRVNLTPALSPDEPENINPAPHHKEQE